MDAPGLGKPRNSQLATASFVLGLTGFVLGFLTGIPAVISGHAARSRIRKVRRLHGGGFALAGLILGYVTTFGSLLLIVAISALNSFSEGVTDVAREQAADARLREFVAKIETYRVLGGDYPTNEQGLRALVEEPATDPVPRRWKQQFAELPLDPWGGTFLYRRKEVGEFGTFEVTSRGPDGLEGTTDDRSSTSFP